MSEQKSPVHLAADALKLHVETPQNFKDKSEQDKFVALEADAAVVIAYGLLLPPAVIDGTRLGCFNLHASQLPRWRGAAPIQRAIMAGDTLTAATVMRMDHGLDTGPICMEHRVTITDDMTASDLHDRLASCGADLMVQALAQLEAGSLHCRAQPEVGATYAKKLQKAESRIDFSKSAHEVHNHIRGLSPFPGAWFEVADPTSQTPIRVKALKSELGRGEGEPGDVLDDALTIACGEGAIRLLRVQRAGKRVATSQEFLRGFALSAGTRLP